MDNSIRRKVQERAREIAVEKVDLDELLKISDFITLHVPLTKTTKEIINSFLNMIKSSNEMKSENLDDDQKTKIMSLSGVKQYPMRVKCATLAWHTLISAMEGKKDEVNTEAID